MCWTVQYLSGCNGGGWWWLDVAHYLRFMPCEPAAAQPDPAPGHRHTLPVNGSETHSAHARDSQKGLS